MSMRKRLLPPLSLVAVVLAGLVAVTVEIGYDPLPGNCIGAVLKALSNLSVEQCAEACDNSDQCQGFSYSDARKSCLLKQNNNCDDPILNTNFVFYSRRPKPSLQSPGAANLTTWSPQNLINSADIDRERIRFDDVSAEEVDGGHHFHPGAVHVSATGARFGRDDFSAPFRRRPKKLYTDSESRYVKAIRARLAEPQTCTKGALSNHGDEFVVMFMSNRPDDPQNLPLEIYVTPAQPGNPVNVEVSLPEVPNLPPQVQLARYDDVTVFYLSLVARMNETSQSNRGVRVRSLTPGVELIVYGINKDTYTNDGFLALPLSSLGMQYFIATWAPTNKPNEFGIVATEDGTTVMVELSKFSFQPISVNYQDREYSNGDTIILQLDKYETFLAVNENPKADMTGTKITADKPISVFSGNSRTSIEFTEPNPSRDHLVEQIPPIEIWGTRYVTVSTPGRTVGDYFKIIASQPNTRVNLVALSESFTLPEAGSFRQIRVPSGKCTLIEASNPVLVVMFVLSQRTRDDPERADPAMMILPPIEQFRNHYVFATTDYAGRTPGAGYTNYLIVAAERSAVNGFMVDGRPTRIEKMFNVPNSEFITGYITVSSGHHVVTHATEGTHFMGILYGAGDRESYGYPIGMQLRKLQCIRCRQDNPCDGFDNNCDGQVDEEVCQAGDLSTTAAGDCCSPGFMSGAIPNVAGNAGSKGQLGMNGNPTDIGSNGIGNNIGNNMGNSMGTIGNPMGAGLGNSANPIGNAGNPMGNMAGNMGNVGQTANQPTVEPPMPSVAPTTAATTLGQCVAAQQALACFNSKLTISCPIGRTIKVLDAHFGRVGYLGETTCNAPNPTDNRGIEVNCGYDDIYSPVSSLCEGQGRCEFSVNRNMLGDACVTRNCPLCILYAIVDYVCLESSALQCSTLAGRTPGLANPQRYTASSWLNSQMAFSCGGDGGMSCSSGSSGSMMTESRDLRTSRFDMTAPYSARFASNNVQAWCPQHCDRNSSFLQVDMSGSYQLQGFILQGRRFQEHFASLLGIQYSSDGRAWTELRDTSSSMQSTTSPAPTMFKPIVFPGPKDGRSIVYCDLSAYQISARFIRAVVLTSIGYPCVHFDIMRCNNVVGCTPKSLAHTNMLNEIGVRNTQFTVQCDPGWTLPDGSTQFMLNCNSKGEWEGPSSECTVARGCGDIPRVNGALHNGQNTLIGSRVTYTCQSGRIVGTPTIVCQNNAQWSDPPTCQNL